MTLYNKSPRDLRESTRAFKTTLYGKNTSAFADNSPLKKIFPYYSTLLQKFPQANPIFLALSRPSYDYVIRQKGVCLLCNYSVESYDLTFGFAKEVWLLTINDDEITKAKSFVLPLLDHSSSKVIIIPFDISLLNWELT